LKQDSPKEIPLAIDALAMTEKDSDERGPDGVVSRPQAHSFFAVYKKGQGYWTRVGTALGAILLLVIFLVFINEHLYAVLNDAFYTPQTPPVNATPEQTTAITVANTQGLEASNRTARYVTAGTMITLGALAAGFAWKLMNKPTNVDFLIATDVEMHKVNCPGRKELSGSTRVVIFFLFLIAFVLFIIDISTGSLFQWIGLLKFGPLTS
jgi:preprotein translocase SecE subunit